jgi:hypothetical protein
MRARPKDLPAKRILPVGRLGFEIRLGIAVTLVFTLLVLSGCGAMRQGNSTSSNPIIDKEMETFLQAHQETGDFMGSVLVARGDDVLHSSGYGMADLEHSVQTHPKPFSGWHRLPSSSRPRRSCSCRSRES